MKSEAWLLPVALVLGALVAFAVLAFQWAASAAQWVFVKIADLGGANPHLAHVLMPVLAGIVVGVGLWLIKEIGGGNHAEAITERAALDRIGGIRLALPKLGIAAVSVGGGASVGPELPALEIGARCGGLVGDLARLGVHQRRFLAGSGTGIALSALFTQPLAGAVMALETVVDRPSPMRMLAVLLGCLSAALITRQFGAEVTWPFLGTAVPPVSALPVFLLLGFVGGACGLMLTRTAWRIKVQARFRHLPRPARPLIAGILVAVVSYWLPHAQGSGDPALHQLIALGTAAGGPWNPALGPAFALAKLMLTAMCLGLGFIGGAISPGMLVGAALGVACTIGPGAPFAGAFILAGMVATLATVMRAPLFALVLVWEATGATALLPALLAASCGSLAARAAIGRFGLRHRWRRRV